MIATLLAILCGVFTLAAIGDSQYLGFRKNPAQYALLSLYCIGLTGWGSWYLW